jgi:FemAB-related protein (PEP-CTERM system-associated)
MPVRIRPLDETNAAAWDAFVRARPEGSFFHLSAWARVIAQSFGHATHYALAEQDGAVVGVLPLVRMKTLLFGDLLASTPYCVYGGARAATPEGAAALDEYAFQLQAKLRTPCLEYRRFGAADPGWVERPALYYTFRKPIAAITGDEAKDMAANIPRKQRAEVRKGPKRGLETHTDRDVDALFRVYAESVRNLGSPVFPKRYFRALLEAFPEESDITTVLHNGRAVASVLSFHFKQEVLPYYGGGTREARGLAAADVMYWEVMRRAAQDRGATMFDFGRSKADTGAYAFKKNWGFEPEQLHYCYRLAPGATVPDNNPNNPKYRYFIWAWKRLPLAVANVIGPHLVRGLG